MAETARAGADVFREILGELESDLSVATGGVGVRMRPVKYESRPFSHILCVAVDVPPPGQRSFRVFVKMFKQKARSGDLEQMRARVAHEFAVLQRVYTFMSQIPDIGVVRPVACYPDRLTIVTEEAPGDTLLTYLGRHATLRPPAETVASLERTMTTLGRWLAVFQNAEPPGPDISLAETREYIDSRLARLVVEPRARFTSLDRKRVLCHIEVLWAGIEPHQRPSVLAHADLAIGNVLVADGRVTVLDFAMAHHASRLHDIARLHMQIEMLGAKPWFRPRTLRRLQRALLGGFDAELTENSPLFRLMLLLHRVNNFATVSLRPAPFPAGLYDAHIRRLHRRWLAREVGSPAPLYQEAR